MSRILVHRARDQRRRDAVRRSVPLTDAAEAPSRDAGPVQQLLAEEALAHATRALEALAEPYRHVLILRLVHGLRATEIAHALTRSPGAVRMQLKRGLEVLRRALPKGLTLPAALLLANGRGLAAVRAEVLATVPVRTLAAGVSGAAFGIGGLLLMMKKIVVAASAALVAAALWWAVQGGSVAPGGGLGGDGAGPAMFAVRDGAAAPIDVPEAQASARTAVVPPAVADTIRLSGRCVADESGSPLGGCRVEVERYWNGLGGEDVEGVQPSPQMTGADGRFTVRLEPDTWRNVNLILRAPGRVVVGATWESLRPGLSLELGDVRLAPATLLQWRAVADEVLHVPPASVTERVLHFPWRRAVVSVVLADGSTPAAGQRLCVRWLDDPFSGPVRWGDAEWTTDAAGEARLEPLPPGRLEVCAVLPAEGAEPPREVPLGRVTVTSGVATARLRLPQ